MKVPASTRYGRKMRSLYGDMWRDAQNANRRILRAAIPPEARRAARAGADHAYKVRRILGGVQ